MGKVIAFVGMPGSGKGTCTDYLLEKGFPVVHFGEMIVDEVKDRGMAVNEANERMVREDLRAKEGKDVLAKRASKKASQYLKDGNQAVILDGLYSWTEQKVLRSEFGSNLVLVGVFTPKRIRYDRLAKRNYRPLTNEEASNRDVAEIENLEKGGPIAFADYMLHNSDSPEQLQAELDELLESLKLGIK